MPIYGIMELARRKPFRNEKCVVCKGILVLHLGKTNNNAYICITFNMLGYYE